MALNRPTDAPSTTNTSVKPPTNAAACAAMFRRLAASGSPAAAAVPVRCARYAGTSGSTHGDRNDSTPAANAKAKPYGPVRYPTHPSVMVIARRPRRPDCRSFERRIARDAEQLEARLVVPLFRSCFAVQQALHLVA